MGSVSMCRNMPHSIGLVTYALRIFERMCWNTHMLVEVEHVVETIRHAITSHGQGDRRQSMPSWNAVQAACKLFIHFKRQRLCTVRGLTESCQIHEDIIHSLLCCIELPGFGPPPLHSVHVLSGLSKHCTMREVIVRMGGYNKVLDAASHLVKDGYGVYESTAERLVAIFLRCWRCECHRSLHRFECMLACIMSVARVLASGPLRPTVLDEQSGKRVPSPGWVGSLPIDITSILLSSVLEDYTEAWNAMANVEASQHWLIESKEYKDSSLACRVEECEHARDNALPYTLFQSSFVDM